MTQNHLPTLALIGRPNVGKSALFNRIAGRRIAIVDEEEGITRDRLIAHVTRDFPFCLIDTGGIDPHSQDRFKNAIIEQAHLAIATADTIVMVVDAQVGVTTLDLDLAKMLLKSNKPITLAVNKLDEFDQDHLLHPFYQLGIKKMVGISATHNLNIDVLLETAWQGIPKPELLAPQTQATKIAIVGKPNVGKSTLINALLNEERLVVSPLAGTTRDAIDLPLTVDNKDYLLIDTAGIRRKRAEKSPVEKFAYLRTLDAIDRCDIACLLLDATDGLSEMDKRLIRAIEEAGKGCIILFNKWDLVKGFRMEHCQAALHETRPFLKHVPMLFISATQHRNLDKLFPAIDQVAEERAKRLTTGELNRFLQRTLQLTAPPAPKGKRLRIYYITQVATKPPRFVLFVNDPKLLVDSYKKYLMNQFREHFHFPGVPLIFYLRGKEKKTKNVPSHIPEESDLSPSSEEEEDPHLYVQTVQA